MLKNHNLQASSLPLSPLVDRLETESINNFRDYKVKQVTNNSKKVTEGALFVAIEGFKTDGHQYILEAIKQGAVAIVGEQEINLPKPIPYIKVKNSRQALAQLAAQFYNNPSQYMRLVGVTGTAGKTTTTAMLDAISNQVLDKTGLIGTLHTKVGQQTYSNPNQCTTPNALVLHRRLAQMKEKGISYTSMEVSSHALKLDRVWGLDFDIGIFTNLSQDHLNFHQTIEDYYQSKAKLFTNLKESGIAILNLDDDHTSRLIETIRANYYTYSINKQSQITADKINLTKQGITFRIKINQPLSTLNGRTIKPTTINIKLSTLGYHNVYNALAAFTAGLALGFKLNDIKQGLESFTGIKRRMELIYDQDFTIVDDFAHNPASLTANFKTIKDLDYDNLTIIHFLKGKRGVAANRLNAQLIADWKERLNLREIITTRADSEVISKNKVLTHEENAFTKIIKEADIKINNHKNLTPAIKLGLNKVNKNDLLLLVGGPGLDRGREIIKQELY
ncbi:UDP-N-acetylmuramoyl-L-alanyl-D-glutamate--2,6-diaminopimelate ligase [Halanaerocella petrolearia]